MKPTQIDPQQPIENLTRHGVWLVDFGAPWCVPCRVQEPILETVADTFEEKACIAQMNVDENQETAQRLGIRSIPTLVLFKNGREIQRFVGIQSQEKLASAIAEIID
jgi:thioredoxin 1